MYRRTSDAGTQSVVRTGTVLAVGVIAALQSYAHIYDLARSHFQSPIDARLLPLSVDGLIIAASLALATAPRLARWMLGIGVPPPGRERRLWPASRPPGRPCVGLAGDQLCGRRRAAHERPRGPRIR
jgi:Protein of unknown function (DUF2637)